MDAPVSKSLVEINAAKFFADARERQSIYRKREKGLLKPWTNDPVMQRIYLTNVFREQDRTTVWFRTNIRDKFREDPIDALASTVLFRWFNKIETGDFLFNAKHPESNVSYYGMWMSAIREKGAEWAGQWLSDTIDKNLEPPHFTGAYMIKLENGVKKTLSVGIAAASVVQTYIKEREVYSRDVLFHSLREWNNWFMKFKGLGGFMSYEIVSDLRWTCLARDSIDINLWANVGPGCGRGLSRLYNDTWEYGDSFIVDADASLDIMRWLLGLSRKEEYWPQDERKWEMREVEHFLCEWDKIERARRGDGRIKRKYNGF